MPIFEFSSRIEVEPQQLYSYHCNPGAFGRLLPPWERGAITFTPSDDDGIRPGLRRRLTVGWGPLRARWEALHTQFVEDRQFADWQTHGPFKKWVHWHHFDPDEGASRLTDRIEYEWPLGLPLGSLLDARLRRTFVYRHRQTERDMRLINAYPGPISAQPGRSLRIGITGMSGLVGSRLAQFLSVAGHQVVPLVRGYEPTSQGVIWWPEADLAGMEGLDAVVHLAGETLLRPWTESAREQIYFSRVEGTRRLVRTLLDLEEPPSVLVSASAVGYYGHCGVDPVSESTPPGSGFLSRVCQDWEGVLSEAEDAGLRTCSVRLGAVLSGDGGYLGLQALAARFGLGAVFGSGEQLQSTVDIDDAIGSIYHLINRETLSGAFNATGVCSVTQAELTDRLAAFYSRPRWVRIPERPLRLLLKEQASLFLDGVAVRPDGITDSGYRHLATTLDESLEHHLGVSRPSFE